MEHPGPAKVFVSYHAEDAPEVLDFIEANTDVFIPRAIGMEEDGSDIIDSEHPMNTHRYQLTCAA